MGPMASTIDAVRNPKHQPEPEMYALHKIAGGKPGRSSGGRRTGWLNDADGAVRRGDVYCPVCVYR